jgi:23S rRNA pseudouridine1911/1915/1917 synthase
VAAHDDAHRTLIHEFLARRVRRRYLAVVHGAPPDGLVDAPLGRRRAGRKAQGVVATGRPARTRVRTLAALDHGLALVEAVPETGRTHQIRAHLAWLGCPVAGDTLYGGGERRRLWRELRLHRPLLHASSIEVLGRTAEAPLPDDMAQLVR